MKWYESQTELQRLYDNGRTLVYDYKTLYQVNYSQAQRQYYVTVVKKLQNNYTLKGRILATTPVQLLASVYIKSITVLDTQGKLVFGGHCPIDDKSKLVYSYWQCNSGKLENKSILHCQCQWIDYVSTAFGRDSRTARLTSASTVIDQLYIATSKQRVNGL